MTIVESIKCVLQQNNDGLTSKQIYDEIIRQGLYSFGAENPVGVVNAQLRRRCIGLDFPTAYPIKFFEIAGYEGKKIKFRLISTENTATIITAPKTTDISELLPEEKIKAALQEHLQNIRQQVFDSVLNNSPEFFEHLVVDLLLKMGYGYVYNPITEIPNDLVWEFLLKGDCRSPWGGDMKYLFSLYQGENLGEEKSVLGEVDREKIPITGNSRFGCWCCTMVKEDKSLQNFINKGATELIPLREFRNELLRMRENSQYRDSKRRNGSVYKKSDGSFGMGPFTLEARCLILEKLLDLENRTGMELITEAELKAIPCEKLEEGDFHDKFGIFYKGNDALSFSGSINDSKHGFQNYESIKVFKTWAGTQEYVDADTARFEKIWNRKDRNLKMFTIPQAVKNKIFELRSPDRPYSLPAGSSKWVHQDIAVKTFLEKEHGILAMATGTGKTVTAMKIINKLFDSGEIRRVVITMYGNDLLDQWAIQIRENYKNKQINFI